MRRDISLTVYEKEPRFLYLYPAVCVYYYHLFYTFGQVCYHLFMGVVYILEFRLNSCVFLLWILTLMLNWGLSL